MIKGAVQVDCKGRAQRPTRRAQAQHEATIATESVGMIDQYMCTTSIQRTMKLNLRQRLQVHAERPALRRDRLLECCAARRNAEKGWADEILELYTSYVLGVRFGLVEIHRPLPLPLPLVAVFKFIVCTTSVSYKIT